MFHRLAPPSYFIAGGGPLLGGYDYINNAGAGTPAMADAAKTTGPNLGTYFVGFGEDATSNDANRPHKALAENTDLLDDYFHRDVAIPKVTVDATAVAAVSSFGLADAQGIFVGVAGTPNTADGINTFVEILDNNNNEVIGDPATGARCRVTAIAGATVGTNFAAAGATVTFTVSPPIPIGTTYRIVYAVRGNLSAIPIDGLSFLKVRGSQERDGKTIDFENQISRRSGVDVDALVAPNFQTPDGVRRPKSALMDFDVDMDDDLSPTLTGFRWRRARDASPVFIARLVENPSDPQGLARRLELGPSGVAGVGTLGTLSFFDAQTIAGGVASSIAQHIPFSGGLSEGDDYLRVSNKRRAQSVLRSLNARYYTTVGDGTNTFGDFNGVGAVLAAITAFGSTGVLHIRVKAGTYDITGGTGPSIPSTLTVILEGVDEAACIVQGATADGKTFNVNGGRLFLRKLTLRLKTAATQGGIYVTSTGKVSILDADIVQQKLVFTNSNPQALAAAGVIPIATSDPQLLVDRSFLDMDGIVDTTGVFPLIHILVDDDLEHRDWVIRRSTLRCCDHNPPVKVEANSGGITDTRVRNILFENCRILLASTTDTGGGFLTGNPGVCWLEPLNTSKKLGVDNLIWRNCTVWANHLGTGASSILVHLIPPSIRFNNTTETGKCHIGRVSIEGGDWQLPDANTAHLAFALNCQSLRVRDLRLRGTLGTTGAVPKDMSWYYYASGTPVPGKYASFSFMGKMEISSPFGTNSLFDVENVLLRNVRQTQSLVTGGMADIMFQVPATSGVGAVRHVRVYDVLGSLNGSPAEYRIILEALAADVITTLFEDIVFDGWTGGVSSGAASKWANTAIMLMGGVSGRFVKCGVNYPGGQAANGIIVTSTGATLIDCFSKAGFGNPLIPLVISVVGTFLNVGMSCNVEGGEFSGGLGVGIDIAGSGSTRFQIRLNGVTASGNSSYGLYARAPETSWAPGGLTGPSSTLAVTNCRFFLNNAGAYIQARLDNTTAASIYGLYGVWMGNVLGHLQNDVGPAELQVTKNGAAFGTEALNMRGLDDGFAGTFAAGLRSNRFNYQLTRNGP